MIVPSKKCEFYSKDVRYPIFLERLSNNFLTLQQYDTCVSCRSERGRATVSANIILLERTRQQTFEENLTFFIHFAYVFADNGVFEQNFVRNLRFLIPIQQSLLSSHTQRHLFEQKRHQKIIVQCPVQILDSVHLCCTLFFYTLFL